MTDLKQAAKRIFLDTLEAIEPDRVIRQKLRVERETLSLAGEQIDLDHFDEVVLVGMGKASLKMGGAIESLLGERIKRGILVTDHRTNANLRCEVVVGGHPLPDANSLIAGEKIAELVRSCGERTLIIFLISGGGSALVELLRPPVSLDDLRAANRLLIGCGASIRDINVIRKRLSLIKGGRLGELAGNSKCVALYISDVNPGDIRSIASNPILPEQLDDQEVLDVVTRFGLMDKLPASIAEVLRQGSPRAANARARSAESRTLAVLLLDNSNAIETAAELARQLGFRVEAAADLIEGAYQSVSDKLIDRLLRLKSSFPNDRVCVISGGEVSCPVRGDGIGGRNQEFVLYSATRLADLGVNEGAVVLSCGTDGIDGNSKAAGAVAGPDLVIDAARHGADASIFINNSDSHTFFKRAGGLVITGPSGNNVRDLRILMAE